MYQEEALTHRLGLEWPDTGWLLPQAFGQAGHHWRPKEGFEAGLVFTFRLCWHA